MKKISTSVGILIIIVAAVIIFGGTFAYQNFVTQKINNPSQFKTEKTNNIEPTQSSITLISPNGGEQWVQGTNNNITWSGGRFGDGDQKNAVVQFDIKLISQNAVSMPISIGIGLIKTGPTDFYEWQVGKIAGSSNLVTPGNYYIEVCRFNSTDCDKSSNYFTIVAPTASNHPSITIISPNGGEVWKTGETNTVKWNYNGINDNGMVYLYIINYDGKVPKGCPITDKTLIPISTKQLTVESKYFSCISTGNKMKFSISYAANNNLDSIGAISKDYFSIVYSPPSATN